MRTSGARFVAKNFPLQSKNDAPGFATPHASNESGAHSESLIIKNCPYGVHEVWQIKGTEKDDEMNFFGTNLREKGKKKCTAPVGYGTFLVAIKT